MVFNMALMRSRFFASGESTIPFGLGFFCWNLNVWPEIKERNRVKDH
jgi:hypothetical protein